MNEILISGLVCFFCSVEGVLFTRVALLVQSIAEHFQRTTELLRSKGRMQRKEDLDDLDGIGGFFNCTHLE